MAKYVGVYILDSVFKTDRVYEYLLPERLYGKACPGKLAVVPFGGGNLSKTAIIVSISATCEYEKVKPVFDIPDSNFYLKPDLLELCSYIRDICYCTFGEAVRAVMPAGISVKTNDYFAVRKGIKLSEEIYSGLNDAACDILSYISGHERVSAAQLAEQFGKGAKMCTSALIKLGYVEKKTDASFHENTKTSRYVKLLLSADELSEMLSDGTRLFTPKQLTALKILLECGGTNPLEELTELCGCGESVIRELKKKGAVEYLAVKDYRSPYKLEDIPPSKDFRLSDEQQSAYDTLFGLYSSGLPKAALLYGVTGSGKTNVILKLIDSVIESGRGVIYLVPEIALTSQNISIFAGRYRDRIAVLHSALSVGEKADAWKRIASGEADIVIDTRSAVFAPVLNLGLIVMDEEQESSFKSDMSPKYHARDIARFRCAKSNALMLLASATPSVESFYRAKEGRYTLVPMKNRYGTATLPDVVIHDMKSEPAYIGDCGEGAVPCMIGKTLDAELKENLAKGEQSILFINRRGYHSMLTCRSCGLPMTCPNCSVALTFHKYSQSGRRQNGKMVCHYCGFSADAPKICPSCSSEHIAYLGSGTQTLEENLQKFYPGAKFLRMDTDTTTGKTSHSDILSEFREGKADVLLGTQMVTKGHDFKNVTLAAVILADNSLYLNDFRANEKTFSMITQVLGRAGRGDKKGRAVIQTYSPDNTTLKLAAAQDYDSFYNEEIQLRRASVFPPFCDIMTFVFSGENEQTVKNIAEEFGKRLDLMAKTQYKTVRLIVFGPFEAAVYKLNGKYRLRYIIKCRNDKITRELFKKLFCEFAMPESGVSLSVDVNPMSL